MDSKIDTRGIPKARVLAALYNRAKTQGMGILHDVPEQMTEEAAGDLLSSMTGEDHRPYYFDYLKGRVMKVSLAEDDGFDPRLYDRDNGEGAAEAVIAPLRCEERKD